MECPSFYPETASTPVDSEGTAKGRQQRRMSCPSVGVRTMSTVRDNKGGSRGMNVEWERAKRGKRPNKPNRQTHKQHDGYKRHGSLFCLRSLL